MSASDDTDDFNTESIEVEHVEVNNHSFEVSRVVTERGEGVEIKLSPEDTRRFRMSLDFEDETVVDIVATHIIVYNGSAEVDVDGTKFCRTHEQEAQVEIPDQVEEPGIYIKSKGQKSFEFTDHRGFSLGAINVQPLEEGVFSREGVVIRCINSDCIFTLDGIVIGETTGASSVVPRIGTTEVKNEDNILIVKME